jgi:hypothetical protein
MTTSVDAVVGTTLLVKTDKDALFVLRVTAQTPGAAGTITIKSLK